MKKYLLCLFIGLSYYCSQLNAQTEQLETKVLNALSTLDQAQCPSGRLYDRVPKYYPLEYWRGDYMSDSTSFLISRFSMLHGMLRVMDVDQNSTVPEMNSLILDAQEYKNSDTLRLGVLFYHYDRLHDSAMTKNLVSYQNEQFYDVPGRNESPYLADTLFAFSAYIHLKHKLDQKFILPSDFITTSMSYSSLEIDLDDGLGYRTLSTDQLIEIAYADYGIKRLKCRLTDQNGRIYIAQSILELSPATGGLNFNVDADDSVSLSGVKVFWWYNKNCDDRKIRKPLILIEGFDPLNTLGSDLVFKKYSGEDGLLDRFYENPKLLSEYLHDDDYDVFYIDYKQGHIKIQDNAFYVQQAIDWINERKHKDGSYESNIVIGASMGGVVGYYALKQMENLGKNHEAELYLTVDSPLKGANIPVGMQAFIHELANYEIGGKKLKDQGEDNGLKKGTFALNSDAANQMLYYHLDSDWGASGPGQHVITANKLGVKHDMFYAELESMGNLNIKHYAIANGSIIRKSQQFSSGDVLADAEINVDDLIAQADFLLFNVQTVKAILGTLGADFKSYHNIKALKDGSSGTVYSGKFVTKILLLPLEYKVSYTISGAKPFDNAPGGMRIFEKGLDWNHDAFCFIPTISSLRLNTTDPFYQDIDNLSDVEMTLTQGRTSAAYYSGSLEQKAFYKNGNLFWNEDHVSLNKRLAEYLRNIVGYSTTIINNPLTNNTFNFGTNHPSADDIKNNRKTRFRNIINYDLDIISDGVLWVNNLNRIGYINNTNNPMNGYDKTYELNIIQDCIDTTLILVKQGGFIKIGESSINRKAVLQLNDSTRMVISDYGHVKVECKSVLNVNSGAILTVDKDGKLEAGYDSKIIVRKNGILRINGKGVLHLTDNAEVIVEWGGKIIIENGAILRLQDGNLDNNGRCRILVDYNGLFRYEGPWKHEGNGHIQFNQQSKFSVNPGFDVIMTGFKKNITFLRINTNNKMDIVCQLLSINKGTIDYEERTQLNISGDLSLDSVVIQGTNNYVPQFVQSSAFNVRSSSRTFRFYLTDFKNLVSGITETNISKSSNDLADFRRTTFANVHYPFQLFNCWEAKFDSVYATLGSGCKIFNANKVIMNRFHISHFGTAVELNGQYYDSKTYAIVRNSSYSNCGIGIRGTEKVNLFAYNTQFTNNSSGIHMNGDNNLGIVELGCCTFINNEVAVNGSDILFSISPLSAGNGYGAPGNNKFILSNLINNYFTVAYLLRDIQQVNAEYNYWGGGAPDPSNYWLEKGGSLVPLIYTPYHTLTYHTCPTQTNGGFNNFCGLTGGTIGQSFTDIRIDAIIDFQDNNINGAEQKMQMISDEQGSNYNSSTGACRFHFDYARAFTEYGSGTPPIQPVIFKSKDLMKESIIIKPNPATTFINFIHNEGINSLEIMTTFGQVLSKFDYNIPSKVIKIDVSVYPKGILLVKSIDIYGHTSIKKFIKV
ncbi:MAG: T9SS type A sorting domain-containing protein [Saprospiraceae bacterium]|nr:T9SS type A sorting domain-containing protein [Saprospiraceae bacterium]